MLLLFFFGCVGLAAYFFAIRYVPFLITAYHDSSIQGIEKSRSFTYGLHMLALRTLPFACGIIMVWTNCRALFSNVLK